MSNLFEKDLCLGTQVTPDLSDFLALGGAKIRGSSHLENKIIPEADILLFLNLIEDLKSGESFKGIGRPPSFSPARSYQTMTLNSVVYTHDLEIFIKQIVTRNESCISGRAKLIYCML